MTAITKGAYAIYDSSLTDIDKFRFYNPKYGQNKKE